MTPAEYGELLAESTPPLTSEQIDAVARILVTIEIEDVAA